MKKKTNSVLTGILLTSLVLSGTYNSIESKSLPTHTIKKYSLETIIKTPIKKINDSKPKQKSKQKSKSVKETTNILVLYYNDFNAFGTLKENVEKINSKYEKITNKKIRCEYVLFEEKIPVKNYEESIIEEEKLDKKIHNEIKRYFLKNGPIDKLILGFHMSEKDITLATTYISHPKENEKSIFSTTLTTQEMKQIASKDSESVKYFSKNAQTIFYACSSARGKNSFAEEFSKSYHVNTTGANQSYQGKITCDEKGNYELTSKTNQQSNIYAQILKSPQGTIYLKRENSDYLLDTLDDEVASFEELLVNSEIKITNDSLFTKGMDEFDIDLKLKSCGFKIVEEGRIDKYMRVKNFYVK